MRVDNDSLGAVSIMDGALKLALAEIITAASDAIKKSLETATYSVTS